MDKDKFSELEGKVIENVVRRDNGCLLMAFTDDTYIGVYNKGEFTEESFELGINFYNWNRVIE